MPESACKMSGRNNAVAIKTAATVGFTLRMIQHAASRRGLLPHHDRPDNVAVAEPMILRRSPQRLTAHPVPPQRIARHVAATLTISSHGCHGSAQSALHCQRTAAYSANPDADRFMIIFPLTGNGQPLFCYRFGTVRHGDNHRYYRP